MRFTVQSIASLLEAEFTGNGDAELTGVGRIEDAEQGQLAFLSNPQRYISFAYQSQATALLVPEGFSPERPLNPALIFVKDVQAAVAKLLVLQASLRPKPQPGIHPLAFVDPSAQVDETAAIGAFVYIGAAAKIGAHCVLEVHSYVGANASLGENCYLQSGARLLDGCSAGNRVRLLANAVVGSDGFGHTQNPDGAWIRIPHLGNVLLEDDVEIGACSTVDRAITGHTILKRGVKLDNLVMVAHNVVIDEHTAAAAQVGMAGSARVGKRVKLGGQVGLAGHIAIADDVEIAAQSGIKDSIEDPGQKMFGSPARPFREYAQEQVAIKSISRLERRLKLAEEALAQLKSDLQGGR